MNSERQRLQKVLSQAGVCSRRRAEELMRQGRVLLNGRPASPGDQGDPLRDRILVDGELVPPPAQELTLLLHKPRGVHSTCFDPRGRRTVLDQLPAELAEGQGLHPVGRLDCDSRGALLLSNNGALTLALTHPRFSHRKSYRIWVSGHPSDAVLQHWRQGVLLDGRPTRPAEVKQLQQDAEHTQLELVLREGRNRQIRRVAEQLGHPVRDLLRVNIGPVQLGDLPSGHWRRLHPDEQAALNAVTLAASRQESRQH